MVYKLNYARLLTVYQTKADLTNAKRCVARQYDFAEYLAYLYWGAPDMWPILALVNKLEDPMRIPVGTELVIPTYEQAYVEYARLYLEYRV